MEGGDGGYGKTNYTVTNKSSPGVCLGAPWDRLHRHRQAFPWYLTQSIRGQITPIHKVFPWCSSQSIIRGQTIHKGRLSAAGTSLKAPGDGL